MTQLRPSRVVAALHVGLGGVVVALAGWIVVDSDGHALAVALLVAGLVVSAPFVGELLTPAAFTWRLDEDGLEARTGPRVVRVAWRHVHLARVGHAAGEPALHLDLHRGPRRVRTLRLPVGADLDVLHAALARHLGPAAVEGQAPGQGATPAADAPTTGQ